MPNRRDRISMTLALPVLLAACGPGSSNRHDGGTDARIGDASSADVPTNPVNQPPSSLNKPLGYGCGANSECASDFCVDGVCCESACDQQCFTCHLTGAFGSCLPQLAGDDLIASEPCTGAKTCALDLSSSTLSGCKLKDLQKCSSDAECASGSCRTFYVDQDGDGYGTSSSLGLCDKLSSAPPPGYSTVSGDCCDSDPLANPGVAASTWFDYADACGSFDFNCDGILQQEYTCSFKSGSPPVSCGAACIFGTIEGCH
jgi:hypothetical protein